MGYELDVKKEKGRFIIDKILGLLQPGTVDVDKFDCVVMGIRTVMLLFEMVSNNIPAL